MSAPVGLVMIVRDEEAVIERALRSALPFISTYVIVDTGSTDRTKEIITTVMKDISGVLIDRPWISFGHNRSEALALCDTRMTWAIMLDADDTLAGSVPPGDIWLNNDIDAFIIKINHGTITHTRTQIFRTSMGWRYEGVVHEYPKCASKEKTLLARLPPETYMVTRCEGYRSKDAAKYRKDADLLETVLLKNPTDRRTIFYLAQSYRDAGMSDIAKRCYQRYIDLRGGWDQERYISLVNLIKLAESDSEKLQYTWTAIELLPNRLEAQYEYVHYRRIRNLPVQMQTLAVAIVTRNRTPCPTDLFVTSSIYEWGMDEELSLLALSLGRYKEAYDASIRCALHAPSQDMRERALANARHSAERLKGTDS